MGREKKLFSGRGVLPLVLSAALALLPITGQAGVVSAEAYRSGTPGAVHDLSPDNEARLYEAFAALGLDEAQARARLASLSLEERAELQAGIENLPAGAGVVEVVGVVFIVLLILELVGVTNIFTSF